MKIINTFALLAASLLIGCSAAPKSSEVGKAYIPTTRFNSMNCTQLFSESESLRRAVPSLEAAVDSHYQNQKGVEVVTWVLFWPAAIFLDKGEAKSTQLSNAKGELDAIQTALQIKKCSENDIAANDTLPAVANKQTPPDQTNLIVQRLKDLQSLKNDEIITEIEYNKKRQELIGNI